MRSAVRLKVPPQWLAAPVSLYATPKKKRRPSRAKPVSVIRTAGRHGSRLILEVRDERGKKALRYFPDVGVV